MPVTNDNETRDVCKQKYRHMLNDKTEQTEIHTCSLASYMVMIISLYIYCTMYCTHVISGTVKWWG